MADEASSVLNPREDTIEPGIIDAERKQDAVFFKGNKKRSEIEETTSEIEIGNGNGNEMKLGDEHQRPIPYGMSLSSGVNMTNCFKHCQHYFKRYLPRTRIHKNVLVAYWMMAGYLGPTSEFSEALIKGLDIQDYTGLLYRFWGVWIGIKSSSTTCKHEGFCILDDLGFIDLLDLDSGFNDENHAKFKHVDTTRIRELRLHRMAYLVDYAPTPKSLTQMLAYQHPENEEANNLNVLLIRGCKFLSSSGILSHSSTNFNSLTILEISSSPCSPMDIGIISELTNLECLNLSNVPSLEMLPDNLFHKLRHLRWLIVRGCSKLRSLPSTEVLTKLVVLDLSHCTSLPVFLDIRYPQLQILDLSYTPTVYGLRELSAPKLTHLFIRGSNLKILLIFGQFYNLQVLDLSGCEKLVNLSPFMIVPSLKHLNLCGCASFADFHESLSDQMSGLVELDLSWTKVKHLPPFTCLTRLQNLSLRGLQLQTLASLLQLDLKKLILADCQQMDDAVPNLEALENLEELDLSRSSVEKLPNLCGLKKLKKLRLADCRQLQVVPELKYEGSLTELDLSGLQIRSMEDFNLDFLNFHRRLEILNLSRSYVENLPDMFVLSSLQKLLLADCPRLNVVPNLSHLSHLTTLDVSLPDDSSINNRQLEFRSWGSSALTSFPFPSSLQKLVLRNRTGINELFPNSYLKKLDVLDLRGTDVVNCDSILLKAPLAGEIHVVYGTKSPQPCRDSEVVDDWDNVSTHELASLISDIQNQFNSAETSSTAFQLQLQKLHSGLRYILQNIGEPNNLDNRKRRRKVVSLELIDAMKEISRVVV